MGVLSILTEAERLTLPMHEPVDQSQPVWLFHGLTYHDAICVGTLHRTKSS